MLTGCDAQYSFQQQSSPLRGQGVPANNVSNGAHHMVSIAALVAAVCPAFKRHGSNLRPSLKALHLQASTSRFSLIAYWVSQTHRWPAPWLHHVTGCQAAHRTCMLKLLQPAHMSHHHPVTCLAFVQTGIDEQAYRFDAV